MKVRGWQLALAFGAACGAKAAMRASTADMPSRAEMGAEAAPAFAEPTRELAPPLRGDPAAVVRKDFRETVHWSPSIVTDATGRASVTFALNDSITSFRAIAEGVSGAGLPGRAETLLASRQPLSVAATMPVEVTTGDRIDLPVIVTNDTPRGFDAVVTARFGAAFAHDGAVKRTVWVPARGNRTVTFTARVTGVTGEGGAGDVEIAVSAGTRQDAVRRTLAIAPQGFAAREDFAGTLSGKAKHTVRIPDSRVAGTVHATARLYPSPVASMLSGVDAMVREPGGCFEQASSTNFPNVMALRYLKAAGDTSGTAERARGPLERGYQLLASYESPGKGYEWFGADPGHAELTAMGVLQFKQMAEVFPGVESDMVARTVEWLKKKRDGKGGYQHAAAGYHTWTGQAEVGDAYITYALASAGETDLKPELQRAAEVAKTSDDPYVLALSAGALLAADPQSQAGKAALARLAAMQAEDGHFPGAQTTVTVSGGVALEVETTALATLALLEDASKHRVAIDKAADWLTAQRDPYGGFGGSTQATVLALQALAEHAATPRTPRGTEVSIWVDGERAGAVTIDDPSAAIVLPDVGDKLGPGEHTIELRGPDNAEVPYSIGVAWHDRAPESSPEAPVAVKTSLARKKLRLGKAVRLTAKVENVAGRDLPMTMARVGIPGGLRYQTWQLDELVEKGKVDLVETREREVILYFRDLPKGATRTVPIELIAAVPGKFRAPPSSAYLYYTAEHRHHAEPLTVTVTRPVARKKKVVRGGKP